MQSNTRDSSAPSSANKRNSPSDGSGSNSSASRPGPSSLPSRNRSPSATQAQFSHATDASPPRRRRHLHAPNPSFSGSSRDMYHSSTPSIDVAASTSSMASVGDDGTPGLIKYTRTGRVSRATKGSRVHHCDECGKTYTRAEHLRRHQQNHKPGAFPCDIPGCGRSFYREDLLLRHKARHNESIHSPGRTQSIDSRSSAHEASDDAVLAPRRISDLQPPQQQQQQQQQQQPSQQQPQPQQQSEIPTTTAAPIPSSASLFPAPERSSHAPAGGHDPRKSRYPYSNTSRNNKSLHEPFDDHLPLPPHGAPFTHHLLQDPMLIPVGGADPLPTFGSDSHPFHPSSPYSPGLGYDSPNIFSRSTYSQPQWTRTRIPSDVSSLGCFQPQAFSRSPASASATSSTTFLPPWGHGSQSPVFVPGPETPNTQQPAIASYIADHASQQQQQQQQQYILNFAYDPSQTLSAATRDFMEQTQLTVPSAAPMDATNITFTGTSLPDQQRYLAEYWLKVHPLFPVLHRPTFNLAATSPLLRAAVMALGAQALVDRTDLANARILHENCLKTLKQRTFLGTHTYRICDMQAVVLTEVYSISRSRRPPLQLSRHFEYVYQLLLRDPSALNPHMTDHVPVEMTGYVDEYTSPEMLPIAVQCKQRLLLVCYTLDQQHALLFGRPVTSCSEGSGLDLPFPTSQIEWDTSTVSQSEMRLNPPGSVVPFCDRLVDAMRPVTLMTEPTSDPFDAFRSLLVIACVGQVDNDPRTPGYVDDNGSSRIVFVLDQSPQITLAYHTLMLCKNVPVRELLAVAGESWVMAEKLNSPDEYTAAQLAARKWAKGGYTSGDPQQQSQLDVHRALTHACAILSIHQAHPQTGLLFQEWSVYLAAVVLWARVYVTTDDRRQPGLSITSLTEPHIAHHELDQIVHSLVQAGPDGIQTMSAARSVMSWTKYKMEKVDVPHTCGLISGVLDGLGKLVSRGNETGWF